MAEPFVWGDNGVQMTPERIAAERKVAQAMMMHGMDASPIRSPWQGVARVAQGMMGGYDDYRAGQAEKANMAADKEMLASMFPQATAAPAPAAAPVSPQVAPPEMKPPMDATVPIGQSRPDETGGFGSAISSIESGGKYDILGPVTKTGDRAYGKYQVMGSNVGPWTKQYLGQEMTPEQFLRDPAAQDAVFKGKFEGEYVPKYGPQGAAKAWFAGEKGMNNPNAKDRLGTSVSAYADKFTKALGPQVASLDPTSGIQASPGVRAVSDAMVPIGTTEAPTTLVGNNPTYAPAAPAGAAPAAGPAVQQVAQAATGAPSGMNPKLLQAIASPYASEGTKKIAALILQHQMGDKVTYQTTPDGDILALDPHGRAAPKVVYQATPKPISVADGAKLWDPRTRTFIGGEGPAPTTVPGADGKPIAIPPGLSDKDRKEFTKRVTESVADAASGKKTEVQAKDEKFANKMELAEYNIGGRGTGKSLEGEAGGVSGLASRGLEYLPGGNLLQRPDYQKFKQARDNFITALLRDESGAAIGTSEFVRYERELFPQPGDKPGVIEQKREARRIAIEAMKKGAGPGYKSPVFDKPKGEAPTGVDAKIWAVMTPEERALWKS